jgi:hypothetical protein
MTVKQVDALVDCVAGGPDNKSLLVQDVLVANTLQDDINYILKNSLTISIRLAKGENLFIPLIFCATGFRLLYYMY